MSKRLNKNSSFIFNYNQWLKHITIQVKAIKLREDGGKLIKNKTLIVYQDFFSNVSLTR